MYLVNIFEIFESWNTNGSKVHEMQNYVVCHLSIYQYGYHSIGNENSCGQNLSVPGWGIWHGKSGPTVCWKTGQFI